MYTVEQCRREVAAYEAKIEEINTINIHTRYGWLQVYRENLQRWQERLDKAKRNGYDEHRHKLKTARAWMDCAFASYAKGRNYQGDEEAARAAMWYRLARDSGKPETYCLPEVDSYDERQEAAWRGVY